MQERQEHYRYFPSLALLHCHSIVVLLLGVCTGGICTVQSWAFMAAILPVSSTDRQTELIR